MTELKPCPFCGNKDVNVGGWPWSMYHASAEQKVPNIRRKQWPYSHGTRGSTMNNKDLVVLKVDGKEYRDLPEGSKNE